MKSGSTDRLAYQHFEIRRLPDGSPWVLGRGAMGVTYRAVDTNLLSDVALKVINPRLLGDADVRARFLREARAAAAIRHANVASVLYLGEQDEEYFYAMEFVEGRTVEERIREGGVVPVLEALEIARQTCRALGAAAKEGVIHRDIKPSNLMLAAMGDGEIFVKVIDFGLAKVSELGGGQTTLAGFHGTPHYASPEQVQQLQVDQRTDFYSLGATLFTMVTGRPLFDGAVARILAAHLTDPPPVHLLAGFGGGMDALVAKALAKRPEDRFSTAGEFRAAIERVMESLNGVQLAPPPVEPVPVVLSGTTGPLDLGAFEPGSVIAGEYALEAAQLPVNGGTIFAARSLKTGTLCGLLPVERGHCDARGAECVEVVDDAGHAFLAIGWPTGPTLLEVMKRRRALPVAEMLAVMVPLARHLDALGARDGAVPSLALAEVILEPDEVLNQPIHNLVDLRVRLLPVPGEARVEDATVTPVHGDLTPSKLAAMFVCELLGAQRPGAGSRWTPLPPLGANGNAAVRLALEEPGSFESAAAFVEALRPGAKPPPRARAAARTAAPSPAPSPLPPRVRAKKRSRSAWPLVAAVGLFLVAFLGAAVFFLVGRQDGATPDAPLVASSPTPAPEAEVTVRKSSADDALAEALRQADDLRRRDDHAGALAAYAEVAERFPGNPESARQMEMISAMLRSNAVSLSPERFGVLRIPLERAAGHGVVSAQMLLGENLRQSAPTEALRWFEAAAARGQTEAMTQSGLMLASGLGRSDPDFSAAVAWFQQGAAGGDTDAMVSLAECLLFGKGIAANPLQAVELLRTATALNHPRAMNLLGDLLIKGTVIQQNPAEARELFSRAAQMGFLDAKANLGVLYANGTGVPRDPARAIQLWSEGAAQGNPLCMTFLARALEGGLAGPGRAREAHAWYVAAARAGDPGAIAWCRKNQIAF